MRPQGSGSIVLTASVVRAHRVVARRAVLRHQGGGDPARQGRGGRVRPRRHPGELRVPGHVPLGDPRRACPPEALDAIAARHPLGLGAADDLVGAYSYLASDASRWTTGSAHGRRRRLLGPLIAGRPGSARAPGRAPRRAPAAAGPPPGTAPGSRPTRRAASTTPRRRRPPRPPARAWTRCCPRSGSPRAHPPPIRSAPVAPPRCRRSSRWGWPHRDPGRRPAACRSAPPTRRRRLRRPRRPRRRARRPRPRTTGRRRPRVSPRRPPYGLDHHHADGEERQRRARSRPRSTRGCRARSGWPAAGRTAPGSTAPGWRTRRRTPG